MKTAVSIPDDVYAAPEDLVRRLGTVRSQIYADALREYLARHDEDAVTAALNAVCDTVGEGLDSGVVAASRRILQRVEW